MTLDFLRRRASAVDAFARDSGAELVWKWSAEVLKGGKGSEFSEPAMLGGWRGTKVVSGAFGVLFDLKLSGNAEQLIGRRAGAVVLTDEPEFGSNGPLT